MSKGKSQPFRQGSPQQNKTVVGGGGGGVESVFREGQVQIAKLHQPAFPEKAFQVKVHQKKGLFSNMLPELIPKGKIHSVVKGLFSPETLPKVKLVGKSQHFLKNWKKLTGDKKKWILYRVTKSHFTCTQSRVLTVKK